MLSRRAAYQTVRSARPTSNLTCQRTNLLIWIQPPRGRGFACSAQCRSIEAPCGVWLLSNPSPRALSNMVSQMPRLGAGEQARWTKATFFITPAFANLFTKPAGLQSRIINHIFGNIREDNAPESFVAIVDALPGPEHFDPIQNEQQPFPVYEGIAMLLSESRRYVKPEMSQTDRPTIRFYTRSDRTKKDRTEMVSYDIPVANTLFVNGQENTFYRQKWVYDHDNRGKMPWRESQELRERLQHIKIIFPSWQKDRKKSLPVRRVVEMMENLKTLTDAVRVTSSMGNIVREVEMADGKSGPASTELEQIVPEFVKEKKKSITDGSLRVFALVYPPKQEEGVGWPEALPKGNQTDTMLQDWLLAGASLHQVTSGGGGWGKKQGLLSLDPAVDFRKKDLSKSGLLADLDIDADSINMPKTEDLVPPGHMIQFFAHFQSLPKPGNLKQVQQGGTDMSKQMKNRLLKSKRARDHYCFATTLGLNSSDFLSDVGSTASNQTSDESKHGHQSLMLALPQCFGMLTTGPIAISNRLSPKLNFPKSDQNHELHFNSLINVPDTVFNAQLLWTIGDDTLRILHHDSGEPNLTPTIRKHMSSDAALDDDAPPIEQPAAVSVRHIASPLTNAEQAAKKKKRRLTFRKILNKRLE